MVAMVAILVTVLALIRWQRLQPLPMYWDEANYINQALVDHRLLVSGGFVRGIKALLFEDPQRPPAYRAFAMVGSLAARPTLPILRMLSLAVSLMAMVFLWRGARTVGSAAAAWAAVAAVFAMPGIFLSAGFYGTEFPLFLAIALLLYSLLRERPVGVAVAVAIGCLAKTTFPLIALPAVLADFILKRSPRTAIAALAGAALAAPWWAWHWRAAFAYARYGASGGRWAAPSLALRLREVLVNGTGPGVAVALLLLAGLRPSHAGERRVIIIALASALPLLMGAALSPVFVARHFSPAFLPLALLVAMQASRSARHLWAITTLVLLQALVFACFTSRFLPRAEQIDWSFVRESLSKPKLSISMMGIFPGISPPEIRYAWLRRGEDADVRWLWSADEPSIDWNRIMSAARTSDAVIVVSPGDATTMRGFEWRDNKYDAEMVARLSASRAFAPPRAMSGGVPDRHTVLLYTRR